MTENGIEAARITNPRVTRERRKFGRLRMVPFTVTYHPVTRQKQNTVWSLADGTYETKDI